MIRELDRMLEEARDDGEQVAGVREAALLGLRRHVATVGFLRIAGAINTLTSVAWFSLDLDGRRDTLTRAWGERRKRPWGQGGDEVR